MKFNRKLYGPMFLGAIINPINTSIIAVALIPIGRAFGLSPASTAWLVSVLYLASAIGQPVVGKLIDNYGPRNLFLMSSSLILMGTIPVLYANQFWILIASRVLIGLGSCVGYPAAMYIIRTESQRIHLDNPSNILSLLAIVVRIVTVLGPVLGGLVVNYLGWRSAFLINIPLSLFSLIFGLMYLPKITAADHEKEAIDIVGMVLFAGMMIGYLLFMMKPSLSQSYLLIPSTVLLLLFVLYELKLVKEPFLSIKLLWQNKALTATYLRTFFIGFILYSIIYGYTQWLQDARGLSPDISGFLLIPLTAVTLVSAVLYGKAKRIRFYTIITTIILLLSCSLLLVLQDHSSIIFLCLLSFAFGIPQGWVSLANQNALYLQAEPHLVASSTGLMRTFQYLGAILASSVNGILFQDRANTLGIHRISYLLIIVSIIVLIMTILDKSLGLLNKKDEQGEKYERAKSNRH